MWEPTDLAEKKFNIETHRIIAESQLHQYGIFLDKYDEDINKTKQKLTNTYNVIFKPVHLELEVTENVSILHLVDSSNKILTRILGSLTAICKEINLLSSEAKILYRDFLLYEEDGTNKIENVESASKIIESLQKVLCFVERSQRIIQLLLQQICSILDKGFYTNSTTTSFLEMLQKFTEILVCLITFDSLLNNTILREHIFLYRKTIRSLVHNTNFNVPREKVKQFDKTISLIEKKILGGRIFKDTLVTCLDDKTLHLVKSCSLNTEFAGFINQTLFELEKEEDLTNSQLWIQLNAIFVFYVNIFGIIDKKLIKRILDINKKFSACIIVGNIMWYPEIFLLKHIESTLKLIDRKAVENQRTSSVTNKYQILPRETTMICNQACFLMIGLQNLTKLNVRNLKVQNLQHICFQLHEILKLVNKTNEQIQLILNIHIHTNVNMTKSVLTSLCKLFEILKGIQYIFNNNFIQFSYFIIILSQQLSHKALQVLNSIKKNITQEKSYKEHQLDVLSSLNVCEQALKGPNTKERCTVAKLALSASGMPNEVLFPLKAIINQLCTISYFSQLINEKCDCSFLFWHQVYLLPVFYSKLFNSQSNISRLYEAVEKLYGEFLHCGIRDDVTFPPVFSSGPCLRGQSKTDEWVKGLKLRRVSEKEPSYCQRVNSGQCVKGLNLMLSALSDCAQIGDSEKFHISNKAQLKLNMISPLNQLVETNLRLQTHTHLELPAFDPIQNYISLNFYKYLPAFLDFSYKSIKNDTEHYLSGMFYNLTTVVLNNWKTYGEMRRLATLQYGLNTVDDNLPMQTIEQGLDVLEIMRNINVFVSKYLYNLNCQVFIEESSNSKFLNSINISHVANSIRTHGIGIMSTTVNFTYQFLKSQFYIFSQFMFDEHIKSRLLKDLRFFNENKNQLNQMYPYERAEKFHIGIKKLGLNQNGQSYLDLFRKIVTHIGNAMGYIRLIKSGGRRCLADGTCFIPDLKEIETLKSLLTDENLPNLTKISAENTLNDLRNFADNFEEATEYFKLLVNVFSPVFRNKNNIHLNNFYIIVPPLTINFIEHSLNRKERLNKKNKADSAFTDDGFALGLAYIIELLEQEGKLNSLHWFHSVQVRFKNERSKIDQQKASTTQDNTNLNQTLTLTEKRIATFEKEFQLLFYSYNSARLFFQS